MNIEEIQELLAEHENRISFLENSQPYRREEAELPPIILPEHKFYGELQQTKGKLIHFEKVFNKHCDKKRDDYKYK